MTAGVLIVGDGLLAEKVEDLLSSKCHVIRSSNLEEIPKETELALILDDSWHPSIYQKAEVIFHAAAIPWFRAFISFGEGIIGPMVMADRSGCTSCADLRRLMAGPDRIQMLELQNKLSLIEGVKHDAWISVIGIYQMAIFIRREVEKYLHGEGSSLERHIFITNLRTLNTFKHFFCLTLNVLFVAGYLMIPRS